MNNKKANLSIENWRMAMEKILLSRTFTYSEINEFSPDLKDVAKNLTMSCDMGICSFHLKKED